MVKRFAWSLSHAVRGLRTVWKEEHNFRIQTACGTLVLGGAALLGFSTLEIAALVIAVTLVLVGEVLNTAVEDLLNALPPHPSPAVGKIKDMMAGFVLVHSLGAAVIGALGAAHHFLPALR